MEQRAEDTNKRGIDRRWQSQIKYISSYLILIFPLHYLLPPLFHCVLLLLIVQSPSKIQKCEENIDVHSSGGDMSSARAVEQDRRYQEFKREHEELKRRMDLMESQRVLMP